MSRPLQKKSNVALLTEGQGYIQRAKKARREQVEEIKFDHEARREWLTGFSKRKKAKADDKRARAKERDKQAHLEERRKARQDLRERAAENVKSIRKAMGLDDEEDEEETEAGPSTIKSQAEQQDQYEYSDDEQLATVTITEDFDPSAFSRRAEASSRSESPDHVLDDGVDVAEPRAKAKSQAVDTNTKTDTKKLKNILPPSSGKLAKLREKKKEKEREKARSRSMETNAERKKGREMEARRRTKKASLAIERDGRTRGVTKGKGAKGARGKGGKGGKGKGRK